MYTDDERLADQRGQLTNPLPAGDVESEITWKMYRTCQIARLHDGVYTVIANVPLGLDSRPTWVEAWRGSDIWATDRSTVKRKLPASTPRSDVEAKMRCVLARLNTAVPPNKSRKSGRCG